MIPELHVSHYWDLTRMFDVIIDNVKTSPDLFQWEKTTQAILDHSESIQLKYANTLCSFGVEVNPLSLFHLIQGMVLVGDEYNYLQVD
jgi:hypothetical protein